MILDVALFVIMFVSYIGVVSPKINQFSSHGCASYGKVIINNQKSVLSIFYLNSVLEHFESTTCFERKIASHIDFYIIRNLNTSMVSIYNLSIIISRISLGQVLMITLVG